ncbi:MFS transporter [Amycolatopsis roodepoortensis]|uniref:MFS transporter n=1 Tax=Amycolatopsis roodepoortensis TaxID=700274 RepID=UPI00214AC0E4|nr:MFS transporter [Amycolatopsis roodepoortensis]UUV30851.1 MFS transporter [Amycolatopsis roodepoortensis]
MSATRAGSVHWTVVVLCFLAILLDGFDTAALSLAIPTMAAEWAVTPAAFTLAVVLTNIGVVFGYLSAGYLGARIPGRRLVIGAVVLFGVATIATAATLPLESIALLSATRLVTGIGLGVVVPAAVGLATKHSAENRREQVSIAVALGLGAGAGLGGLLGGRLLNLVGSDGVFYVAGIVPLLFAAVLAWLLPAEGTAVTATVGDKSDAKIGRLFDPGLRLPTTLIWAFSFLVFITSYVLISWIPTLLTGYGFSPSKAPLGLAFLTLGGIIGGLALLPLAGRLGIARAMILMPAIGGVFMIIAAKASLGDTALLLCLAGAGVGVVSAQLGQLALAVATYPPGPRTTGVGWAAALGRLGSIVGPGIAGVLIGQALATRDIVVAATVPLLFAIVCAVMLSRVKAKARVLPAAETPLVLEKAR